VLFDTFEPDGLLTGVLNDVIRNYDMR
jgi:hypothetical protein